MTAPHADQLIEGYLARLGAAAADLSPDIRQELVSDMRAHIAEARSRETDETDATILNILDRLGEPETVVSAARPRSDVSGSSRGASLPGLYRPGILEIAALTLLPFIWPLGVILLWVSPAWNLRAKITGSLLPPGGYPGIFIISVVSGHHVIAVSSGSGWGAAPVEVLGTILSVLLVAVLFLLPLITVAYLAVRLRWGRSTEIVTV
jgi:hypothetical protein